MTILPEQGLAPPAPSARKAGRKRVDWLSLREEFSARRRALLFFLAFALPLGLWSAVSYIPFLWHPLVLVTHAGDEAVAGEHDYLSAEMLVGTWQEAA